MHPGNVRISISLLLSFATFLCGDALVLVSFSTMGLTEDLVSRCQRAAAKWLRLGCHLMVALTLVSLLALLPGRVHLYLGLAFVTVLIGVQCYYLIWCPARTARAREATDEEQKKLDAASKVTSCVTYSAFGGMVGVVFDASKVSAQAGAGAIDAAAYSAIFFLFASAILGMLVMKVSKMAPEVGGPPPCRQLFIAGVMLANAFLLCTLACAALAASFAVLRCRIFAAFAPLVISAAISLLLLWRGDARRGGRAGGANLRESQEARIKAMEDIASKVMVATLGGIMSVLGGWLGEEDHAKWGAMDVFMVILTSAFVSSFGFTVLVAAPGTARARLAPAARILIWSTVALFAATPVAVYAVEAGTV
ncbi:hypothetical protein PVAP13_4KG293200 [Panicum virgatum]|uniref:Uncharacterized protein n=2 Tax=Panicum virgatum TaxID=38727 RepID=A0A8T0TTK2_PANVG|nr:hypothetical protein PVAP13_4KG293200 [Panicum virgatum]